MTYTHFTARIAVLVLLSLALVSSQGQAIPKISKPIVVPANTGGSEDPTGDSDDLPDNLGDGQEDNTSTSDSPDDMQSDTPDSSSDSPPDASDGVPSEDIYAMCENKCASLSKQCNTMCEQGYTNDPGKIAVCKGVCNVIFNHEKNQCEQSCVEIANSVNLSCSSTLSADDDTASDSEATDEQK